MFSLLKQLKYYNGYVLSMRLLKHGLLLKRLVNVLRIRLMRSLLLNDTEQTLLIKSMLIFSTRHFVRSSHGNQQNLGLT